MSSLGGIISLARAASHLTLALALGATAFGADRPVSATDCRFVANRAEFLGRKVRDRREIYFGRGYEYVPSASEDLYGPLNELWG